MGDMSAKNINKDPIDIPYKELLPVEGAEDSYRRKCPVCKNGILLVRRDPKTLKLMDWDICVLCGQRFFYLGKIE